VSRRRGNNARTTFGRPAPKNSESQKNVQISARFLITFDFDRKYLQNGSTYQTSFKKTWSTTTPSTLGEKLLWTLVHKQKSLVAHIDQPTSTFFWRLHFGHRGCCALKFLHALPKKVSPKNFNRENLKFGLKFSVWASITSGLVGISSPNFSRRRGELW